MATEAKNIAPRKRRTFALGDEDTDLSVVARNASEATRDQLHADIAAGEVEDKIVTVNIARDFKLTTDDHKVIDYKAGIDEMPLSHATHWFAKNAGGVTLHVSRRSGKPAPEADSTPALPPQGDVSKMPKPVEVMPVDTSKSLV